MKKSTGKSGKSIIFTIAVTTIITALACLLLYLKSVSDYKQAVKNITIGSTDISKIADGEYTGECNVDFIYAKVMVTVSHGEITDIEIMEHKNERGAAAEEVLDKIIREQKIDVDAVSGATNSSTVLKKAVENAFVK